jgi:Winged helix DNA-binding domain
VASAISREQVLAYRVRAQQLDRPSGTVADTAVLDIGAQDTGTDGALWALALRGLDDPPAEELATVWTLRGAPHVYRRADLPGVAAATAPFSEADAGKRIVAAGKPLKDAGIPYLEALDVVADAMRSIVTGPTVKGEMSTRLTAVMTAPYVRHCVPCQAIHVYESPFRLAALRAGLELQPGTSPPVLQPIPGFAPADAVPERLDVVRGYLRLLGPATPAHVAGYLDAPQKDVKALWPADAVEVTVDGERRWLLADDVDRVDGARPRVTRLLGAYDLFLQARDRQLLVADAAHAKELWRTIGRPGAVLVDGEIVGTWRAAKSGTALTVSIDPWAPLSETTRTTIGEQAERLAAFRKLTLKGLAIAA